MAHSVVWFQEKSESLIAPLVYVSCGPCQVSSPPWVLTMGSERFRVEGEFQQRQRLAVTGQDLTRSNLPKKVGMGHSCREMSRFLTVSS